MIDYCVISNAISFYASIGYEQIDAPWLVSEEALDITTPKWARKFKVHGGCLVASGEQSFLEIRKGLKPGTYQCTTPCFRDELKKDKLHLPYFMKVELIRVLSPSKPGDFSSLMANAKEFFGTYAKPEQIKTDIGMDLEIAGIEVGSYGFREHDDFKWIYGTGCAEPRLSQAMARRREMLRKLCK